MSQQVENLGSNGVSIPIADAQARQDIATLNSSLTNKNLISIGDTARVYDMGGGYMTKGSLGILQLIVKAKSTATNSPIIMTFSSQFRPITDVALSCIDITSGITNAITSEVPCGMGTGGQVVMKEMTIDHIYAITGMFILA